MTLTSDKPLEYDRIYQHGKSMKSAGKMKMVAGGIGWKEASTSNITTLRAEDFQKILWSRQARDYQLCFITKNDVVYKFDGFPKEAFDTLNEFVLQNYSLPLEEKDYSLKGWNWGKCVVQDHHLAFTIEGKSAFEVPLTELSNASVSAKNEVTVELQQNDTSVQAKKLDSLVDVRFFIPPTAADVDADGEEDTDAATAFCNMLKSRTEIGGLGAAERIVTFQEIPFAVPRGRYECDLYLNVMRLRGKSYDYKIPYSSILKLFLLPKIDDLHVALVIALDPPLRQGQTRYPFLIIQFSREDMIDTDLTLSAEVQAQFGGKLKPSYEGPLYEVFSTILKTVADKKIIVPGSFKSANGVSCVKCSMKASEGHLYFLERSFLFIQKPTILIPHEDLISVTFSRVDALTTNARTFDATFSCRGGVEYMFSNVAKEELPMIESFLSEKRLAFQNELVKKKVVAKDVSDSESDAVSIRSERAEGDEESSTDEDYQEGDDETEGSGSDSETGSEDDSAVSEGDDE